MLKSFVAGNSIGNMSQYHEEVEEMADDYEMGEAGNETGDEYQEREGRESDSDDEEFGHSVCCYLTFFFCISLTRLICLSFQLVLSVLAHC